MFQIFGTWLYHIHIYYICRSVDQQGDSDSKYIFPFDPYTESDISIPGPFCCSEAYPSSIAVGLEENGMVGNGGGGQGQWTLGSPPGSPYSPHLTVLVT